MSSSPSPHREVISLIEQVMKERNVNYSQLARMLNLSPSSVQKMMHGKAITIQRLKTISVALNYNFFAAIAVSASANLPSYREVIKEADQQQADLEKRIYELEIENRTLLKLLKS